MKSWIPAARAASSTSACVAAGRPLADVLADRRVEQERRLPDHRVLRDPGIEREIPQVEAVDVTRPRTGSMNRATRSTTVLFPAPEGTDERQRPRPGARADRTR